MFNDARRKLQCDNFLNHNTLTIPYMQFYDEDLIPLFDPQDIVRTTTTLQDPLNRRYKLNQYVRGEKIGKGKHGDVYLCKDEAGGYDLV